MHLEQALELHASNIKLIGKCDAETFPLQKKHHTLDFLRDIAHLRPRTNTIGGMLRVRHHAAQALHRCLEGHEFIQVHTPVITASDCEGAGEMFSIKPSSSGVDNTQEESSEDFFGEPAYLSVSGQLQAEVFASAMSRAYTFGPTFRAENSNTSRHLAEFWMLEPEMAWAGLNEAIEVAEECVQAAARSVLQHCEEDVAFFSKHYDATLQSRLNALATGSSFARTSYTECITALQNRHQIKAFEKEPVWGMDLGSEHERWLTDELHGCPVFVIDWPREIKPFYMRLNDDERTVAAMDLLVPGVGELVGGSAREERLSHLEESMQNRGVRDIDWYVDLRRYGSVPHAGFGLGFERLILFLTGLSNVRDAIPFPRYPGYCKF